MATIMLVDDSSVIRNRLLRNLSGTDFQVVAEARDGIEALDKYRLHNPDIVTMDLTMPQMNGLECIRRILQLDPHAKILVVSAINDRRSALQAISCGAKGFLCKPFTDEELIEQLGEVSRAG